MTAEIISLLMKYLVPMLEEEFIKHEPQMQEALLNEAKVLLSKIEDWINHKIQPKGK